MKAFFHQRGVWVMSLLLTVQAAGFYKFSQREETPTADSLSGLPDRLGEWQKREEVELDAETRRILRPDDYVLRSYERASDRQRANVFIAYFRSQRTGHTPHSPQNCLPGRGWAPEQREVVRIPAAGHDLHVNRIRVAKGNQKMTVLYWYQTPTTVVASEYRARLQLVLDSIRYHRSDTALVRVELPATWGENGELDHAGQQFVERVHQSVQQFIPTVAHP